MKKMMCAAAILAIATPVWAETPPPPPETPMEITTEPICEEVKFTVYFADESADISRHSRRALEAMLDQIGDCAVTKIEATTLSKDVGSNSALVSLSEARTDSVLEAFAAAGVWANEVQSDIVLTRSNNRTDWTIEPLERRVEVTVTTVRSITS